MTGRPAPMEVATSEITRALALTIAYKAAVDDDTRAEVVAEIRAALETAYSAFKEAP